MKRFIIIGATSSIAEHCARLWIAEAPINLTLVGRDASRTKSIADDLKVRSPGSAITVVSGNLVEPDSIQRLVDQILKDGNADCALIAHGSLADQSACQQDLALTAEELSINGISPVLFAEAIANSMVRAGHGTLGVIGSVAGDRGRKSNYVYGAGKGLITRYAQGLQHRLAGTGGCRHSDQTRPHPHPNDRTFGRLWTIACRCRQSRRYDCQRHGKATKCRLCSAKMVGYYDDNPPSAALHLQQDGHLSTKKTVSPDSAVRVT